MNSSNRLRLVRGSNEQSSSSEIETSVSTPLRIVQLNSPFENRGNPEAWNFFSKLVALRMEGYGAEYPADVIPVGLDDLYATHHAVCRQQGSELIPLVVYKEVSFEASRKYGFKFSPVALLDQSGSDEHKSSVASIVEQCDRSGETLLYLGSLTIDPKTRQDREMTQKIWEIVSSILIHRETDSQIKNVLSFGNVRFKMHRFFHPLGYHDLEWQGRVLDPIGMSFAHGELVKLYHRNNDFPSQALESAKQYRALWDARHKIGNDSLAAKPAATKKAA